MSTTLSRHVFGNLHECAVISFLTFTATVLLLINSVMNPCLQQENVTGTAFANMIHTITSIWGFLLTIRIGIYSWNTHFISCNGSHKIRHIIQLLQVVCTYIVSSTLLQYFMFEFTYVVASMHFLTYVINFFVYTITIAGDHVELCSSLDHNYTLLDKTKYNLMIAIDIMILAGIPILTAITCFLAGDVATHLTTRTGACATN